MGRLRNDEANKPRKGTLQKVLQGRRGQTPNGRRVRGNSPEIRQGDPGRGQTETIPD